MEKKLSTARAIAAILAILLVVAAVMLWNDRKTIADLRGVQQQNITVQGDIIRKDCSAPDVDSKNRCTDDLQKLSDLLATFSKQLHASSTSAAPAQ